MTAPEILDTTLRDGSYAINFSFSLADVRSISSALEDAGVDYIELGHGVGLNGSSPEQGLAPHSDTEYIEAAKEVTTKAKIGAFCIPGIARLRDLEEAADNGMDFVRVGTPVSSVPESRPFIQLAKKRGMLVMANYMKAYTSAPNKLAREVLHSEEYGADAVYIVDSSGGMFESQIEEYTGAIREVSDIALGFHGHNNLGLAVANTLKAAKLGYRFLDCSLQGLGRSSGNASTEHLVACLLKQGYPIRTNLLKIINCGYEIVNRLVENRGLNPIDTVAGYSDFHTSYMHYIHKYASKYSVNPLELIIDVCKIDTLSANDELVESVALKLHHAKQTLPHGYPFHKYHGKEQDI